MFLPTDVSQEAMRACDHYSNGYHAAWNLAYSNPQMRHARHDGATHLHPTCHYGHKCDNYTPEAEVIFAAPLGPCTGT